MNAIDFLAGQHREVEELLDEIEQADDPDDKFELVEDLADLFSAHSSIEEQLFYPAAYQNKTQSTLEEAVQEHLSARRVLADLLEMSPDDENFDAKVKVLKEQIEDHVQEEEGRLFPEVRTEMEAERLETLGAQMAAMFEDFVTEPRDTIPRETTRSHLYL